MARNTPEPAPRFYTSTTQDVGTSTDTAELPGNRASSPRSSHLEAETQLDIRCNIFFDLESDDYKQVRVAILAFLRPKYGNLALALGILIWP
ncbi:hypothetical protein AVEN_274757-1 [Araneus ventricosus]|uniref:Uncharacterized protein n=1 Tax=Araneus ventricosus TaxID=182803 RepID=A0A4Y2S372_ARAVE|nr:hypothetical protein AVEN_274757-1 [Araneus ventricosus]